MTQLADFASDVASQTGEDGVIARILELLEIDRGWCVEFGAWDGQHLSNTYNLLAEQSWSGVLIEGDEARLAEARNLYSGRDDIHCICRWVNCHGADSLDGILATTPIPTNFELLSIDIDGADYHVWDSLKMYRPKVVVIEYNPAIPNAVDFSQPCDMAVRQGSSLAAMIRLGRSKGYQPVAALPWNAFFVEEDLYSQMRIEDNAIDALRQSQPYVTHLSQLFDGTLIVRGNRDLLWREGKIDADLMQVVDRDFVYDQVKPWQRFLLRKLWRFLVRKRLIR